MNARALGAVALVLLVVPLAIDPAAGGHNQPPQPSTAEWWGPTPLGSGHHIRVPVTVQNPLDQQMDQLAIRAQIDVAKALADAGWIHTDAGGRQLLKGFHLDGDSVRVVRVSGPGASGRLITNDADRSSIDRNVIPSVTVLGGVEGPDRSFDPVTSPLLTVFWWTNAPLGAKGSPTSTQHYHVYLDSLRNRDHPPAALSGPDVGAAEAMHWTGPSSHYYGVLTPTRTDQDTPTVTLVGLHDRTVVDVDILQGTSFRDHQLNPTVTLDRGESATVGLGSALEFRLRALDGTQRAPPFLAYVDLQGFAPALTGGHAGRSFLIDVPDDGPLSVNYIAPHGRQVTVTATATDGTGSRTHQFGGTGNLPYTVGAWANGATGPCQPTGSSFLPAGRSYQVTATDDILVALGGQMRVQQVPATDGGPTGTEFAVTLEEHWNGGNGCQRMEDARSWWALGDTATTAFASSPESTPQQFDPTITSNNPNARHTVPAAPDSTPALRNHGGNEDRPVFLRSAGEMTVFAGSLRTGQTTTSGALGGADGGLRFSGFGPFAAVGLYDDTRLQVSVERVRSGTESLTRSISQDQALRFEDGPDGDTVSGFRVEATRPVVLYGLGERPGFLAGRPAFADATVGVADFRGYLLDLAPAGGVEPATASTVPGAPVTYTFHLRNLARGHDGSPVADSATLTYEAPDDWIVELEELDHPVVSLAPGGTETVRMTVTPPDDAAPRSSAAIPLVATSTGNDRTSVSTGTVTYIKRSFDVGVWFDVAGGPKTKDRAVGTSDELSFRVVVRNEGTVTDTVQLALSGVEPGWDAALLLGGNEVDQVTLADRTEVELDLVVTPPPDLRDGLMLTTVTATSASQPAAFDRITAISRVRAPADIQVEYDDTTRLLPPGEAVEFPIRIHNVGEGPVELALEASADLPEGWEEPSFLLVNHVNGERMEIPSTIAVGPGDVLDVVASTTSPKDSLAGELGTVRALGRPPGEQPTFEVAFTAVTAARHDLAVQAPPGLVGRSDGQPILVDLTIRNDGNLDEHLTVGVARLPAAWSVQGPSEPTIVPRGETRTLTVQLTGPVGAAPGTVEPSVALLSEDGNGTPVPLHIDIPASTAVLVKAGAPDEAQPGRPALLDLNVTNGGNRPGRLEVRAGGEPWPLVAGEPMALQPGETTPLRLGWAVPRTARDGTTAHSLEVVLVPDDGSEPAVHVVSTDVTVERPQIRIVESTATDAPGGRLVVVNLENAGTRNAYDVRIQLRSGERVVDEVTVESLGRGRTASASLLDPDRRGDLRVVVDPDDTVVESNEADNLQAVAFTPREAPGLPVVALLALLVLAALRVSTRSRW